MNQDRSWVGIALGLVLLGTSCATAYRESSADEVPAEMVPTEAELTEQLTSSQPSEAQLRAFEVRAQQKLRDFTDYLAIVANPALDSAFRAEARRQATDLFIDNQVRIALPPGQSGSEVVVLRDLSVLIRADTGAVFVAKELSVSQLLTPQDSGRYTGELVFSRSSDQTTRTEGYAEIVLKKVTKQFGEDEEEVWEVFLGDIR